MCGFCNVCLWICVGFVMYGCVHVWVLCCMSVCMCGFCNVWVCVCVCFVLYGCLYVRVL